MRNLSFVVSFILVAVALIACSRDTTAPASIDGNYAIATANGHALPVVLAAPLELTEGRLTIAGTSFTMRTEYNDGTLSRTTFGTFTRSGRTLALVGSDGYTVTLTVKGAQLENNRTGDFGPDSKQPGVVVVYQRQ